MERISQPFGLGNSLGDQVKIAATGSQVELHLLAVSMLFGWVACGFESRAATALKRDRGISWLVWFGGLSANL